MANPFQGEVALTLNGERHVLKLTLGALAELEAGLQADCLVGLVERYEAGRFSSADVLRVVVAGLRGGGWRGGYDDILTAEIAGGPLEAARVGAELIARAFTVPG
ncbi:gene transfer agent family protein [Celeribacter litoreus]|uniref:gene transfer agent family protein n=1 Tax=Celeribacter litoreus TaxID=2876714 RepID=UPI001CCFD076|nr:gene transfer agent family protein [Celeribacter litoreus]MCA0044703.1 gene transfer agent family protein [Celeribacter litoreus]